MLEELKRAIKSPQFCTAFIVCFATLMGYSLPYWIGSAEEWIEYRESALHLSIGGIFFGGFMLLMPFCAALTHSSSQVDDETCSMLYWMACRGSLQKYARLKIGVTMLVAAIATASAFVLHSILWNCIALPNDPSKYPSHTIYFSRKCLYYAWYTICHGLPVYIEMTIGIGFTASVWAVVSLAIAVWIPDKLLAVVIPSFIYYLWNADIGYYFTGIRTPHPAILFNDGLTIESAMISITLYLVVLIMSILIYYLGCLRRCRYA